MTHIFIQNPLMSLGAQPSEIPPKLEKVGVVVKIFLENTLDECSINILIKKEKIEQRLERGKK